MRYYVIADPHSFFSEMKAALEEKGFFTDPEPHKLILCGDLFDRGTEALAMQEFVLEQLRKKQVILIRGNHEDLALSLLDSWHLGSYLARHHRSNGTVDTVFQLTGSEPTELLYNDERIGKRFLRSPYIQRIIPEMTDYFETPHYIFVHGWIPCTTPEEEQYHYLPDWRQATQEQWRNARWINGMEAAHLGITEPGKTIVCGHYRCAFGHANYESQGTEAERKADFSPYYGPGVIAIDGCTAQSGRVNCIVIDD